MNSPSSDSSLQPPASRLQPLFLPALLLIPLTAGCSTSVGRYFEARALDLTDVVPISVGAGYGLSAEVRVTPFAGLGIGWAESWRAGRDWLRYGPLWWEKERGIPILRYYRYQDYAGRTERIPNGDRFWWDQEQRTIGNTLILMAGIKREGDLWFPFVPPYFIDEHWEWTNWSKEPVNLIHFAWLIEILNSEVGVFVGPVGIRVGVGPVQAIDFVLGFLTIDFVGDDPHDHLVVWPDPEAPPSFPEEPRETGDDVGA